ncbi:121aa long hypothetical protein [Pyrococcus horikoshii OT3]|uniref:Uncharacterized protein n=1 Tax=Pyrococcus horikoshii (strain ATCC 700860 / DSM 12428 / JCM 9974 / NBRC 100139 / OT-3) TaxID=70601 RepID=O58821_PYRHO|nr:121aa long hypothetical protein [Pyrococcus horikoshii OT3]
MVSISTSLVLSFISSTISSALGYASRILTPNLLPMSLASSIVVPYPSMERTASSPASRNEKYKVAIAAIPLLKARALSAPSSLASLFSRFRTVGFSSLEYFNSVFLGVKYASPTCLKTAVK